MAEIRINQIPTFSGDPSGSWLIINNYADIHFIAINQQMEQEGFPSKVYTIMACAKPIIVVTGQDTPLYNFLKDKKEECKARKD